MEDRGMSVKERYLYIWNYAPYMHKNSMIFGLFGVLYS